MFQVASDDLTKSTTVLPTIRSLDPSLEYLEMKSAFWSGKNIRKDRDCSNFIQSQFNFSQIMPTADPHLPSSAHLFRKVIPLTHLDPRTTPWRKPSQSFEVSPFHWRLGLASQGDQSYYMLVIVAIQKRRAFVFTFLVPPFWFFFGLIGEKGYDSMTSLQNHVN